MGRMGKIVQVHLNNYFQEWADSNTYFVLHSNDPRSAECTKHETCTIFKLHGFHIQCGFHAGVYLLQECSATFAETSQNLTKFRCQ